MGLIEKIAKTLSPSHLIWEGDKTNKAIYLTFDDGPTPQLCEKILEILEEKNIKANFFLVGENVKKHPELFQKIIAQGHGIGNHTYNHLKGWKSNWFNYTKNTLKASQLIDSNLFRPPYGKIKASQIRVLKKRFCIVMWSVLTYDIDKTVSKEKCLKNALKAKPGSIVVFHDNIKAAENMLYALPKFINHYLEKGYKFKVL